MPKAERKVTQWQCRKCGQLVTINVTINYSPVCTRHTGKGNEMELIANEKESAR